jgi:transcriptional regulator with XRE-family HTH domain
MSADASASGTAKRQQLAQRRKALGLTQEALASLLDVERSTVVRWERGETEPLPWIRPKLAKALRVSADRLVELLATGAPLNGMPGHRTRPHSAATVPRQLPAAVTEFTGRTAELQTLTRLLGDAGTGAPGTVVISAIGGTAGVGKTALAVQWAHQVAGRFPDGQLYVNLCGHDPDRPMPPADALAGFLRALGVPGPDISSLESERAARYRSLMDGRRMLVVLDNARSVEQVRPLLPDTPACAAVVTSRDALAGLVDHDGSARLDLDLLPPDDSVGLLRALIGERADADTMAAETLAGQCCRLPLALRAAAEVAAARPAVSLADLTGELAGQRRRLGLPGVDGDRDRAVRAVLSWAYQYLDAGAAQAFRLAGPHPGPEFDPDADALAGTVAKQAGRVLDVLGRAHLIRQAGPGRYRRHEHQTVTELATAVTRQWTAEAEMRSLHRPQPVQLRWSSTGRPVAARAAAVLGHNPGTAEPKPLSLRGDLTDLVAKFRQLPKRQLVVLGEPGAGKTVLAILLTLGLLNGPKPGEPVPVLLPVSSWNPQDEHLHTWLARRLIEEYPGLANTAAYGPQAAQRLVAEGRILPVLDGLDEVPPALHAAAIDAVDQAIAGGRPLVVTCRGAEYEEAVLHGGTILATAAVVEIEPVDPSDAAAFLTARQPHSDTRWQPVVEHLRRYPARPLALALSTALMVDLTRTAYSSPRTDPAELCDLARFPDRASVEGHLLDAFLPAVYTHRHPPPAPAAGPAAAPGFPSVAPRKYELGQAQQWLTFLARHLERGQSRDFAWWQLPHAIPRPAQGLLFGLPAALLFALAGELAGSYVVAAVYGVSFASAGCVANALGRRPGPLRVEIRFRGTAVRFLSRFGIGLAIGLGLGLSWSLPLGLIFVLVLAFGLALGVQVWLDIPADANRVSSPVTVLRQDRAAALSFTSSFALSVGTFYGVADAFAGQSHFILVFGGHFDLVLALATGLAGTLLGQFAFGWLGGVAYGLAATAAGGLVFPIAGIPVAGFAAGAVFGLAVGLSIFMSRAWGSSVVSMAWLAMRGQVPLRLVRFLDDAHGRGVLRQVGGVYQFRHARLQDRLTEKLSR